MKRLSCFVLAACMVFTLAACSSSTEESTGAEESEPAQTEEESADTEEAEASEEETAEEPAEEEEKNPKYEDMIANVPYEDDGNELHTLDLFGTESHDEPTPTIVEVHGGAFFGGDKETNTDHSIVYADAGFIVVTPEYRKVPADGDFSDTVRDLFAVYNWVADHAEEYHFDLNNIFISGDSAGGYYTLLTDAIWHSEELQQYFDVTLPDYDFSAYVTTCPLYSIEEFAETGFNVNSPSTFIAETIGDDILNDEDLMSHLDLKTIVEPEAFEGVYMMTTPSDTCAGPQTLEFDEYLTENNVEHTLNSYEGTENDLIHVFNVENVDYVESQQANQDIIDFLKSKIK